MDLSIILTAIGSVSAIIACNMAMFSWLKSDLSSIKSESAADRRDILQIIRQIQLEIKDFHGSLCAIEEKNKK
jgi:hypothetical protein